MQLENLMDRRIKRGEMLCRSGQIKERLGLSVVCRGSTVRLIVKPNLQKQKETSLTDGF